MNESTEPVDPAYIPKHRVWQIPNPYNLPIHDQGPHNSCTAHAFAAGLEYTLSAKLEERAHIDVNDLWSKQKQYGTATDEGDDVFFGPQLIWEKYGVRFKTDYGKTGTYYSDGKIEFDPN